MSDEQVPEIAVLIPARNEAASIARCLEHVLDQDVDRKLLEVIVVDGGSEDGTAEIATSVLGAAGLGRWTVHRNSDGSTPSNLNAGLRLVTAPVVCRVDARSLIPPHYVRTCRETLTNRADVAVTGGAQVAFARSQSNLDRGIARALNNRYGMGLSRYRRGARSGPSDTVYLGAFRTGQLREVDGWDRRFGTNQDFDLNRRMSAHGAIWYDDSLEVGYLPRGSVGQLFRQYRRFGLWKARYWQTTGDRPQTRQVALVVVPAVGLVLGLRGLRYRPRTLLAAAALGALVVDAAGSRSASSEPPAVRVVSTAALAAVAGGWWSGVVEGLARWWGSSVVAHSPE